MIAVEVDVPALGRRYDFQLEETSAVRVLIREMTEVICQKEHCRCADGLQLSLYDTSRQVRLDPSGTLLQNRIAGGTKLILM